jgi:hypothetical protein
MKIIEDGKREIVNKFLFMKNCTKKIFWGELKNTLVFGV